MKKLILSSAFSLIAVAIFAFSDTETRTLGSFDEITVSSGITAELVKSSTNKIDITVDGIDLDQVSTEIDGDHLKVKVETKSWFSGWNSKRKVEVVIYYSEELEGIKSTSGSRVHSDDIVESESLELISSSGSNMDIEIEANELTAKVSSGASMSIAGESDYATIKVSSGSSCRAYDLVTNEANLKASSGANLKITVKEKIIARANSGASISYHGNPTNKDIDKSSGGSVSKS